MFKTPFGNPTSYKYLANKSNLLLKNYKNKNNILL